MAERSGVEMGYCPECQGIWLDRGELDKILERASSFEASVRPRATVDEDHYGDHDRDDDDWRRGQTQGRRKKRSFLSDIFEFGD